MIIVSAHCLSLTDANFISPFSLLWTYCGVSIEIHSSYSTSRIKACDKTLFLHPSSTTHKSFIDFYKLLKLSFFSLHAGLTFLKQLLLLKTLERKLYPVPVHFCSTKYKLPFQKNTVGNNVVLKCYADLFSDTQLIANCVSAYCIK